MTRHRARDNSRATPTHYAFLRVPLSVSFSLVLSATVPSLEPSSARKRTKSERDVKKHASSTHSAVFAFLDSWRRLSVFFQSVANARERGENLYIATALEATFVRIFAPFVPLYPFCPGNEKRERWFRKKSGGKTLRRVGLLALVAASRSFSWRAACAHVECKTVYISCGKARRG